MKRGGGKAARHALAQVVLKLKSPGGHPAGETGSSHVLSSRLPASALPPGARYGHGLWCSDCNKQGAHEVVSFESSQRT